MHHASCSGATFAMLRTAHGMLIATAIAAIALGGAAAAVVAALLQRRRQTMFRPPGRLPHPVSSFGCPVTTEPSLARRVIERPLRFRNCGRVLATGRAVDGGAIANGAMRVARRASNCKRICATHELGRQSLLRQSAVPARGRDRLPVHAAATAPS